MGKRIKKKFAEILGITAMSLLCLTGCQGQTKQESISKPISLPNLSYLLKDSLLFDHLRIEPTAISFYENWETKRDGKTECKIYADEIDAIARLCEALPTDSLILFYKQKGEKKLSDFPAFLAYTQHPHLQRAVADSLHPLKGLKIALDPGHVEAEMEMAETEGKFIRMKASPETGMIPLSFNEANLTLATAEILADLLQKEGAQVMITRPYAGIGLLGLAFKEWQSYYLMNTLVEEVAAKRMDSLAASYFRNQASTEELYQRLYVPIDLRLRAEKINRFQPDLSVIIHYNVHGPNWELRDADNNVNPTDKNYNMAFVAGSFKAGELRTVEDRVNFLRLLISSDLPRSIRFSECVMESFEQKLQVPPVSASDELIYLKNSSIALTPNGVYARNLNLTRNIKGVLCYGESLCQDNRTEAAWLNQKLITLPSGLKTSSRVKMVAEAYFEAILKFYRNKTQK